MRDDAQRPPTSGRTAFFGRSSEQKALLRELGSGARLITITGPSGVGKTRLARQLQAQTFDSFGGGAWFCSLASCATPADVCGSVAQALGLPVDDEAGLAAALARRGPLLLVLDNLEQLSEQAAPLLEGWLDRCPELQLLATSLVPLAVPGELRYELGSLDPESAVALYLDRARGAWADRSFGAAERPAVEELVLRLDRLPLAIELAAARVRILPPRQMLQRLAERLELLHTGEGGRHGSLAEALSVSWNLLDSGERRVLAFASVFAGGFTLEAAEGILGDAAGAGSRELFGILDSLRAKALLQLDDGDPPRFSLYESVRLFAALQLESSGDAPEAATRHAAYFLGTAEAQVERSDGPEAPLAIRWLLAERENLISVHRRTLQADPAGAARAGLALSGILAQQGPPDSELEILEGTIEAAQLVDDPRLLARALWARARTYKRLGKPALARADLDDGLRSARAAGDRVRAGYLLAESGAIRAPQGQWDEAIAELEEALRIGVEEEELLLQGIALLILGALEESRGVLLASRERLEEALAIFEQIGHLRYQGIALLNLGAIDSHLGAFSAARHSLEAARRLCRLVENRATEAFVLTNLGSVALTSGDLDEAERSFLEVLALEKQVGNRLLHALATAGLGTAALERGLPREGEHKLSEGISMLRRLGAQRHLATQLPFRAAALAILGRRDEAQRDLDESRAFFEESEDGQSLRMLELIDGILKLATARTLIQAELVQEAAALEARAHQRLSEAMETPARTVEGFYVARRLLEKTFAHRGAAIHQETPAPLGAQGLRVGPATAWFQLDGGQVVDLRRRTAIRLILRGLVEQRLIAPGVGISLPELVAMGWPGERIHPDAAAARVWSGIRTLRSLGLTSSLLRHADGYLLDPRLPVVRSTSEA